MPPRDDEKAMDGLLRRSLARDTGACPDPDILAAYSERSLAADELAHFELHLSQCTHCREQLAAIFRAQSLTETPREREFAVASSTAPRLAVRAAASTTAAKERRAAFRLLDWRWLAPVAALAIVVVFVYRHDFARVPNAQTPANDVALSRQGEASQRQSADQQPGVNRLTVPPTTPPAAQAQLLAGANNSASKTPAKMREKQTDIPAAARADYELRNNLSKRAEADSSAALGRAAPAESDSSSAARTAANDSFLANQQVPAAPAPAPPTSLPAGAKEEGTRTATSGQQGAVGALMAKKAQSPNVKGAVAAGSASARSQMIEAKSATAVIQTPDTAVQYRVAGAGVVERSQDGGATWQGLFLNSNAEIFAGAAPSEQVCWLVGRAGAILLTTDGNSWKTIPPPAKVDYVGVAAKDAASAILTATDGRKFSTEDGGATWRLLK